VSNLVYIVDDEPSIQRLLVHWLKNQWHYEVKAFGNGTDFLNACNDAEPDLVILDIMLPDIDGIEILKEIKTRNAELPVIMISAQGSVEVALKAIKIGAYDYFTKPITETDKLGQAVKNALKQYEIYKQLKFLKENLIAKHSFDNIISTDERMHEVFDMVSKVLDNDITVLIHGESGTGKELIARAIHYNGKRKDNPFVVVNCASIPRELLESELFGHEKGSFTGAHQRKIGKFELAKGGTLFLDEIGEMEMSLQAKILRVIQEKEFERVGGNDVIKTDVRIISATNKDLKKAVKNNQFREDLYYRLNSFPIFVPPLRERKNDIFVLTEHFIKKANEKLNRNVKGISKRALKLFYDYDWPGNVRELENTIERCVILTDKELIDVDVLPQQIKSGETSMLPFSGGNIFDEKAPVIPFEKLKEEAIKHALKVTNNNIVDAARKLKIGRATLYRLMEKYNIKNN
jgi:DNA-binding NtrC family response regulator